MVKTAGRPIGTRIDQSTRPWLAPSRRAASTISRELLRKYARIQNVPKASDCATCGKISET